MFMWKCLHNIVLVNEVLLRQTMPVDRMCPLCGLEPEIVDHMLFQCDLVIRTLMASPFQWRPEMVSNLLFGDAWRRLGSVLAGERKGEKLGLFAFICWNIWKGRNEKVFQGSRQQEEQIGAKAVAEFHEFCRAVMEAKQGGGGAQIGATSGWQHPPQGVVKINVDGAFITETDG